MIANETSMTVCDAQIGAALLTAYTPCKSPLQSTELSDTIVATCSVSGFGAPIASKSHFISARMFDAWVG